MDQKYTNNKNRQSTKLYEGLTGKWEIFSTQLYICYGHISATLCLRHFYIAREVLPSVNKDFTYLLTYLFFKWLAKQKKVFVPSQLRMHSLFCRNCFSSPWPMTSLLQSLHLCNCYADTH